MNKYPGLGVMIGMLGGNLETVNAVDNAVGKTIASAEIAGDVFSLKFSDGSCLSLRDDGQSCGERRFMVCDDDLSEYDGAKLLNIKIKDAPDIEDSYGGVHEVQFLEIETSKGAISVANHVEHNGYYGGFWITANLNEPSCKIEDDK